jgi:hypothetical protein
MSVEFDYCVEARERLARDHQKNKIAPPIVPDATSASAKLHPHQAVPL